MKFYNKLYLLTYLPPAPVTYHPAGQWFALTDHFFVVFVRFLKQNEAPVFLQP